MLQTIDTKKYISMISPQLDKFVWKGQRLANCRCFVCGDSQVSKTKARGYFYLSKNGNWRFKCHNCGCNYSVSQILKHHFPEHYKSYCLERIQQKDSEKFYSHQKVTTIQRKKPQINHYYESAEILFSLKSIHELPPTHIAKDYIQKRHTPSQYHKILFFTDSWGDWIHKIQTGFNLAKKYDAKKLPKDPRIVIPFYDKDGNIYRVSGRSIDPNHPMRYITCDLYENHQAKPYGIERFDVSKLGYMVEGPFDSLLLPNCIAMAGSNIPTNQHIKNIIFIYDNEPRNKEICKSMHDLINSGNRLVIWEPGSEISNGKDITNLMDSGKTQKEIMNIIHSRIFSGIEARLEFNNWKKRKV